MNRTLLNSLNALEVVNEKSIFSVFQNHYKKIPVCNNPEFIISDMNHPKYNSMLKNEYEYKGYSIKVYKYNPIYDYYPVFNYIKIEKNDTN